MSVKDEILEQRKKQHRRYLLNPDCLPKIVRKTEIVTRNGEEKEETSEEVLEGYAAVFNSVTDLGPFTEEISEGAFRESISRGDDVRMLFNHDSNYPFGRTTNGSLRLSEDKTGLKIWNKPAKTQLGQDMLELIRRGDVSQMSIGFYIEEELSDFTREKPHFTIQKIRLVDVSPVTFPAYEATSIQVLSNEEKEKKHEPKKRTKLEIAKRRKRFLELMRKK